MENLRDHVVFFVKNGPYGSFTLPDSDTDSDSDSDSKPNGYTALCINFHTTGVRFRFQS